MDQSPSPSNPDNLKPTPLPPDSPPPSDADSSPSAALTPSTWVTLLILAVIAVVIYRTLGGMEGLLRSVLVAVGVGFIIFIHELGHFLAAKWCDVHVQTFSIGFGPAIPGCSFQYGETTYKLALLPLGGYVNMVGEGFEAEEDENYPRSFKNKSVGQRMLIISAGVIMNVILGAVCFVIVFTLHGIDRQPAVVGMVDPGSPIWARGIPTGSTITNIGGKEHPFFDDLQQQVVLSREGEAVPFTLIPPGPDSSPLQVDLVPRRDENDPNPIVGVAPPHQLRLWPKPKKDGKAGPFVSGSAAAAARPLPLKMGEIIVACTDPKNPEELAPLIHKDREGTFDYAELARRLRALDGHKMVIEVQSADSKEKTKREVPAQGFSWDDRIVGCTTYPQEEKYNPFLVEPLPVERGSADDRRDPFVFHARLVHLAGKPMVIQVRRKGSAADAEPVNLFVPPAFHRTLGLRMKIGKIAAVREGSPAEQAGLRRDDLLSKVKMVDASGKELYAEDPKKGLDPDRLADDLRKAAAGPGKKKVILTVRRSEDSGDHNDNREVTLPEMSWQDRWDTDNEMPMRMSSPMAIPQLGLAYWITSHVVSVEPGSSAEAAGLKANDQITDLRLKEWNSDNTEMDWPRLPIPASSKRQGKTTYDCWAYVFTYLLQHSENPAIQLWVTRDGTALKDPIELETVEDPTWPLPERGLRLQPDYETQKADSLGQAVVLGCSYTVRGIKTMYLSLRSLVTGRVSAKNLGGPVEILHQGFLAGADWYSFLGFVAFISINLAVINFLPIPVLDGGHMVFLIYEKLRGRPPSENVRIAATYAGLAVIGLLMIFVLAQDIGRHLLGW